ncbi:MAG: NADH-quinone oxidoreductase subunit C [Actinomycetota bacterium]
MSSTQTPVPSVLHGSPLVESAGQSVLFVDKDRYFAVLTSLANDGFEMCVDLTAVDFLTHPGRILPTGIAVERFEIVVNLLSLRNHERLRLRVQISESDATIDSAFDIYPGTEAMEREVYDMFGIVFRNHPDLTRILMPEDWDGHPLRKDYAQGRIPVQFKGAAS